MRLTFNSALVTAGALGFSLLLSGRAAHAKPACDQFGVSRFWQQLDVVCNRAESLRAVAQQANGQADALAVLAYCEAQKIPEFAKGSVAERSERLKATANLAGISQAELGAPVEAMRGAAHTILDHAAARVAPNETLQTGALGDLLVTELTSHVCARSAAGEWLQATCAPSTGEPALIALRKNLVRDIADLPSRAFEHGGGAQLADAYQAQAAIAFVNAALSDNALYELAGQLAAYGATGSSLAAICRAEDAGVASLQTGSASRAGYLLFRLLADGTNFQQPDDYYRGVVLAVLGNQIQATADTHAAITRLIAALRALSQFERQPDLGASTTAALVERSRLLLGASEALLTVSLARPFTLPPAAAELANALLEARLESALSAALSLSRFASEFAISDRSAKMMDAAVRFALARDEDEAKRILRSFIIPLGPWSEKLLFDLNGDIPQLKSGEFKVVGDGLLGYNARSWGIAGRGSFAEYDFSTTNRISETTIADGSLETWLASSTSAALRLELRLIARTSLYDTNKSDQGFSDETSLMGRGAMLGSMRYQPGSRVALGVWLGGGAQYEWYDSGDYVNRTALINDTETWGAILNARVRFEVVLVPRWVTSRVRVDGQRFALTRQRLDTVAGGGTVTQTASAELAEQIEVSTRLFLDAEVARFGGFVPSLNGGFDSINFRSDSEFHSAFVPVFGAGIRRETF